MADWKRVAHDLLLSGPIEGPQLAILRKHLYADTRIDRDEFAFVHGLRKELERPTESFLRFYRQAVKDVVLDDGTVSINEVRWLQRHFAPDGKLAPADRALIAEIRSEAKSSCPEFLEFCAAHGVG
jgi:hypothetical protein